MTANIDFIKVVLNIVFIRIGVKIKCINIENSFGISNVDKIIKILINNI